MRRSSSAWMAAVVAAAIVVAGCGGGVDDESAAPSTTDGSSGTIAETPADEPTSDADFITEVDALCADTVTTLRDDLSTTMGDLGDLAAAGDFDAISSGLSDAAFALDTLVVRYDDLEPTDEVAVSAVNELIIYLGEFSASVHTVQEAAAGGDAQELAAAARAFTAPESDAAEAAATDLADLGAESCAELAG